MAAMSYCTIDDIKRMLPEQDIIMLTNDASTGTVDMDVVADAIAYADQLIDGYLRGRYTLPLSTVPMFLTKLSIDLVIFYLYGRRPEIKNENIEKKYTNTLKILEHIQAGKFTLVDNISGEDLPGKGEYKTNKTENDRIFSKDMLSGY
jgi:phage gp36-like protein